MVDGLRSGDPHRYPRYGEVKDHPEVSQIVVTKLVAVNERGVPFQLVSEGTEQNFGLAARLGSFTNLGSVSGEKFRISAEGYTLTRSGTRDGFTLEETRIATRSTRFGLAVQFIP